VPDALVADREQQLRHWTEEALSVVNHPAHLGILKLCRKPEFKADSPWIAQRIGANIDEVNLALTRLLRLRLLQSTAPNEWKDVSGLAKLTEKEFHRIALARVREKAAAEVPSVRKN
jgi:hypothetical protein